MITIAFDPGGTTGIAMLADYGALRTIETEARLARDVMPWLNERFSSYNLQAVVVEYFATAGLLSKYGLETIDLVGQIKGWCLANDIRCVLQSPQSRKAWVHDADEFLKMRKHVIHEVDALSHLFQYLETVTGFRPSAVVESLH